MTEDRKLAILKSLDTKSLITKLSKLEDDLEIALRDEALFRDENYGFLGSQGSDCAEVKRLLAELNPPSDKVGKKMTVADKEAWLILQRTKNDELAQAINHQKNVAFKLETYRIAIEMAKKRLEGVKAVLGLRTAQIKFLAEG